MNKVTVSIAELMPLIEEKLASGGEAVITVKGTSMNPFFLDGKTSVTLTKPTLPLKRLDVILYETDNGAIVLHRIIGKKGEYYRTEGDGLRFCEVVAPHSVKAVVSAFQTGEKITRSDDPPLPLPGPAVGIALAVPAPAFMVLAEAEALRWMRSSERSAT